MPLRATAASRARRAAFSRALPPPDGAHQKPEPDREGDSGYRAFPDRILERIGERRGSRLRGAGGRAHLIRCGRDHGVGVRASMFARIFQAPLRLLLCSRPEIARRVRNLVRKTTDRILHRRHLLFQTSKSVIPRRDSRSVASFSVGWKISCHAHLRNRTSKATSTQALMFPGLSCLVILIHIKPLLEDQRHHQNWRRKKCSHRSPKPGPERKREQNG